jgi:MtN3 and saliva related transmembrane protein
MKDAIGWASSAILLITIAVQDYKQWKSGESKGVSKWLFIGNMTASLGFGVYSWLLGNRVFIVTNTLMIVSGIFGWVILWRNKRRASGNAKRGS